MQLNIRRYKKCKNVETQCTKKYFICNIIVLLSSKKIHWYVLNQTFLHGHVFSTSLQFVAKWWSYLIIISLNNKPLRNLFIDVDKLEWKNEMSQLLLKRNWQLAYFLIVILSMNYHVIIVVEKLYILGEIITTFNLFLNKI